MASFDDRRTGIDDGGASKDTKIPGRSKGNGGRGWKGAACQEREDEFEGAEVHGGSVVASSGSWCGWDIYKNPNDTDPPYHPFVVLPMG